MRARRGAATRNNLHGGLACQLSTIMAASLWVRTSRYCRTKEKEEDGRLRAGHSPGRNRFPLCQVSRLDAAIAHHGYSSRMPRKLRPFFDEVLRLEKNLRQSRALPPTAPIPALMTSPRGAERPRQPSRLPSSVTSTRVLYALEQASTWLAGTKLAKLRRPYQPSAQPHTPGPGQAKDSEDLQAHASRCRAGIASRDSPF